LGIVKGLEREEGGAIIKVKTSLAYVPYTHWGRRYETLVLRGVGKKREKEIGQEEKVGRGGKGIQGALRHQRKREEVASTMIMKAKDYSLPEKKKNHGSNSVKGVKGKSIEKKGGREGRREGSGDI